MYREFAERNRMSPLCRTNLLYGLKGLAFFADKARKFGAKDAAIDLFILEGLFATVTNVDFDPARLEATMCQMLRPEGKAKGSTKMPSRQKTEALTAPEFTEGPAAWVPAADLVETGRRVRNQSPAQRRGHPLRHRNPHLRPQGHGRLCRPRT